MCDELVQMAMVILGSAKQSHRLQTQVMYELFYVIKCLINNLEEQLPQ